MTIVEFEIVRPLLGGVLIGLSATLLLWLDGRIAGICGITFSILESVTRGKVNLEDNLWRWLFLVGLVMGASLYHLLSGADEPVPSQASWPIIVAGGLLTGFGTKIGSGCTSGHGVCGIARFSPRSILSTVIFMSFGIVSVGVFRHLLGWI